MRITNAFEDDAQFANAEVRLLGPFPFDGNGAMLATVKCDAVLDVDVLQGPTADKTGTDPDVVTDKATYATSGDITEGNVDGYDINRANRYLWLRITNSSGGATTDYKAWGFWSPVI